MVSINLASPAAEGQVDEYVGIKFTFINALTGQPMVLPRTQLTFFDCTLPPLEAEALR